MVISFEARRFSTARAQIMGYAMLCIVFFHSSFPIAETSLFYAIKNLCDIGVDIFLFVSGIGIWFSLNKHANVAAYVQRRCLRILPAFLIVNTLWFLVMDFVLYHAPIWTFIKDITTLSFWLDGKLTTWYLSSLLILQIMSPIIIRWIKKRYRYLAVAVLFPVFFAVTIRFTLLNNVFGHLLIIICRIPIYILGLFFGKFVEENKVIKVNLLLIAIVFSVSVSISSIAIGATNAYLPFVIKYFAYCPLAIIISGMLTFVTPLKITAFFGRHSLEIYLLHEKALWFIENLTRIALPAVYVKSVVKIGLNLLAILATIVGTIILKWLCTKFEDKVIH